MIEFDYLIKGLNGLANAHRAGTMAGHLGAAVITGYFIGEELPGYPDEVYRGIEKELDRIIAGEEAFWYNAKKVGITPTEMFQAFPPEDPVELERLSQLAATLLPDMRNLRQSGHDAIFASIGIRALQDHPDLATPAVVNGIQQLIINFRTTAQGRGYYGKEIGWKSGQQIVLNDSSSFPAYDSVTQVADMMLRELVATAAVKKQGYGGLWHLINHAAALVELQSLGYEEHARLGLVAHHRHLRLWRELPDVEAEFGPATKATHFPLQAEYWQESLKRDQARLTHRIKTIYGYHLLKKMTADDLLTSQADEAFLYLMD